MCEHEDTVERSLGLEEEAVLCIEDTNASKNADLPGLIRAPCHMVRQHGTSHVDT